MKPIYTIPLNSAEDAPNFLDQFKGKVGLLVNTTVGCGNANQMEVLQWLQDKYGGDDFQVIAIPTNDYCGPGITHGKWSQGITCGLDSQNYGRDVYGTTFQFSEMVASNPNIAVNELNPHNGDATVNGLGQPRKPPHELYEEIKDQMPAKLDHMPYSRQNLDALSKCAHLQNIPVQFALIPSPSDISLNLNLRQKYDFVFGKNPYNVPLKLSISDFDGAADGNHFNNQGHRKYAAFLRRLIEDRIKK